MNIMFEEVTAEIEPDVTTKEDDEAGESEQPSKEAKMEQMRSYYRRMKLRELRLMAD